MFETFKGREASPIYEDIVDLELEDEIHQRLLDPAPAVAAVRVFVRM